MDHTDRPKVRKVQPYARADLSSRRAERARRAARWLHPTIRVATAFIYQFKEPE